jgi:hypothetical protein
MEYYIRAILCMLVSGKITTDMVMGNTTIVGMMFIFVPAYGKTGKS